MRVNGRATIASVLLAAAAQMLLISCAQVAELTGGERDTIPPKLVAADPPHLSTDFTGNRITLVFNERIQLERVRERLLISPPLTTPPTVRLTGARTVTIDINGPLRENTTYSFGIGEAIKDLTEGNPAAGLVHVLSTGAYVDSLMIAGKVVNAFTGAPEKEVLVQVYEAADTASIRTSRPAYATRSNAQGRFTLSHLRAGEYRLYALRDQNANYRYDLPNEEIAFLDTTVTAEAPDTAITMHQLRLFQELSPQQQIREVRVIPDGALRLNFNRPPDLVEITDIARVGGRLNWIEEWGIGRDTLFLWPSDTTELRQGRYQISTEDGVIDTVRYRPTERMPFFNTLKANLIERAEGPVIEIRVSRPVLTWDSTRFELLRDSIPVPMTFKQHPGDIRTIHITAPLDPGDRAELRVLPQGVIDIYAGQNDTLVVGLGRAAEQSTGTLRVKLEMYEEATGPYLLQLLGPQGTVIRELQLSQLERTVVWERLAPAMVELRLIEDLNNNGRWDPGILDEGIQPERVWRHAEKVNIRASWDLGVDWEIGQRPGQEDEQDEVEP